MIPVSRRSAGQAGFTYIEMLVATVIVTASLAPAIDALRRAQLAAAIHEAETTLHYRLMGHLETVLAEPFGALLAAANSAGGITIPTSYSEPGGQDDRIVVFLSFYDVADTDGDSDFFTIEDDDNDDDDNPYTGPDAAIDVVWVEARIPGTVHVMQSLSRR